MAFNKLSLLSVEDINVSQVNIQHIQDLATSGPTHAKDIFYHLGTDLLQSSWSNPAGGSYLTVTHNQGISDPQNAIDRNVSNPYQLGASLPLIITFEFLTGFEVDLQAFRYFNTNNSSYSLDTFTWEGSHDGTNWEVIYGANELYEVNNSANTWYYEPILDNRPGFFKWLRLHVTEIRSGSTFDLAELEIYGKLRNLTTGVAGFKTPGDRFDNLLNVDAYNPRINREIIYDATDGVWESRVNQPWTIETITMDNDLVLTRSDLRNPRFYILSPNGAARNVYLPPAVVNDAIKFRNLDGLFDINIREYDVTQLKANLAGYYSLESNGTDSTGLLGALNSSSVGYSIGKVGNAAIFNGASSTLSLSYATPSTSISASCWFNADDTSATNGLVSRWNSSSNRRSWALMLVNGQIRWRTSNDGATEISVNSTTVVNTGTWYHAIGTYNNLTGEVKLYVNGVLEDSKTQQPGGLNNSDGNFIIGALQNPAFSNYFDGFIDEVGYWTRPLTDTDAEALYNSNSGVDYATISGTQPTPVVLNNAGKLQYEYVYDGTEYHVIG